MTDDQLSVERSGVEIICASCGEPADVNVTGIDATVEVGPDAGVTVCRTDRYSASIHVDTADDGGDG